MAEILDIVNTDDEIIGSMKRDDVHATGQICRMVFVLFYTPDKQLILQRRSLTKKSNPGKLTTTVSGHVESGSTYDDTAVKETFEETGIAVKQENLQNVAVVYAGYTEGDYISNAMRGLYIHEYTGAISDLKVEEGEGAGFEILTIDEFWRLRRETPEIFSLHFVDTPGEILVKAIEAL